MQQESIYAQAVELAKSRRAIDIKHAVELFESICGYKDAASQAEACKKRLEQIAQYRDHHGLPVNSNQKSSVTAFRVVACLLVLCFAVGILVVVTLGKRNDLQSTHIYTDEQSSTLAEHLGHTALPLSTSVPTFELPFETSNAITPEPYGTTVSTSTPKEIDTPMKPASPTMLSTNVAVGSIVQYGAYEQDNILSNGAEEIEWIVLAKQDGKALLLSRYGLDAIPFHESYTAVDWSTCTLRTWLNTTFYDTAFTVAQKQNIQTTTVEEPSQILYDRVWETATSYDQLFVLSYDEYVQYDALVDITKGVATAYAQSQGACCTVDNKPSSPGWWLRTRYENESQMMLVDFCWKEEGFAAVSSEWHSVRPAMWVQLEASDEAASEPTISKNTPAPIATPIPSTIAVGDCITFGTYEQDGDFANGQEAIEWLVLDKQDGKALVISLYGLDRQPFNTTSQYITWEHCTLRNWLNNTFYTTAFTTSQQQYITSTTLENCATPEVLNGMDGPNTVDKVFLLSVDEVNVYLKKNIDERLLCMPITPYTKSLGSAWEEDYSIYAENSWLLRTSSCPDNYVCYVEYGRAIDLFGIPVWNNNYVVRPAMWITLAD